MTITTENARLILVICGDIKTLCRGVYTHKEVGPLLCAKICDELRTLPFVEDVETNSYPPNWNGGRYSDQASIYGYENIDGAVCTGALVPGDDEVDAKTPVRWADLPQDVRDSFEQQIAEAMDRAYKAADQYEAELAAAEAALAAAHPEEF